MARIGKQSVWRLTLVALLVAAWAGPALARAPLPMVGTWVTAEVRKAVEGGGQRELGCYVEILSLGRLEVYETCSGVERRWQRPRLASVSAPGAMEIVSEEEGENGWIKRRILYRAGTPGEIEVTVIEEGGGRELRRLYRLDPSREDAFSNLAMVQSRLVGTFATDDGGAISFDGDGGYTFLGEEGSYRVEAGFETEAGAWGVLYLQPSEGVERRYLVHGAGWRIGLAEVPRDLDLYLPSADDDPQPAQEDEGREAEEVTIDGIAIPLPAGGKKTWDIVPAWAEEPQVTLWLTRRLQDPEEGEEEVAQVDAEQQEEEPPPIAKPIVPARSRACGCAAGEGGVAALLLLLPMSFRRGKKERSGCT